MSVIYSWTCVRRSWESFKRGSTVKVKNACSKFRKPALFLFTTEIEK